jgi:hypothetical protein
VPAWLPLEAKACFRHAHRAKPGSLQVSPREAPVNLRQQNIRVFAFGVLGVLSIGVFALGVFAFGFSLVANGKESDNIVP